LTRGRVTVTVHIYWFILCVVAAWAKAWVRGRSLAGIASLNPAGSMDVFVNGVCCQVEVSVADRSLVQRMSIECIMSECDLETSIMRKPRSTRAVEP
jgi:hypothetical protein